MQPFPARSYATIRASVHELDSLHGIVAGKNTSARLTANAFPGTAARTTREVPRSQGVGMDIQLRPSNLGEILDRTAQLYRHNFWLFVGTAALPLLIVFALAIPAGLIFLVPGISGSGAGGPSPAEIGIIALLTLFIALPIYLAVYVYSYAGITQATVSVHLGEKPTIRATLKRVHSRFWTYLWYLILQGIIAGLVPMVAALAIVVPLIFLMSRSGADMASRFALGFLIFLVAVAAIAVMLWLVFSFMLGMPACIVEEKSAWESLVRSWHLSRGTRGRIFVTYLLVIALAFAISMALSIPMLIVVAMIPSMGGGAAFSSPAFVIAEIVRAIANFATQVLLAPIIMIAAVLFYYDQRIRKEGFDIEWMMQRAGLAPSQPQSGSAGILGLAQPPSPGSPGNATGGFGPVTPPDSLEER
jgi:Membrane domain of glycerophosphoryl diester phosphodiesterase